jgi:hypothetical protein
MLTLTIVSAVFLTVFFVELYVLTMPRDRMSVEYQNQSRWRMMIDLRCNLLGWSQTQIVLWIAARLAVVFLVGALAYANSVQ